MDEKYVYDFSLDVEAERDEQYYFPEADCVVRVGATLFKVRSRDY